MSKNKQNNSNQPNIKITPEQNSHVQTFVSTLKCPYCKKGNIEIKNAIKIVAYDLVCNSCNSRWVDENDIVGMLYKSG